MASKKQLKYFDMFSGIGGFPLGIQQAYEELAKEKSLSDDTIISPKCIGYSEINRHAIQIYEKHFKHKNYGSATTINVQELQDFDLLVGGFPCQAFSIAGKRGGFKDTRGTLFFEIARVIKAKKPTFLLLENVKGLLNHDKGNTFATIISTLDELGYDCQWSVLNSKNFGVPQNRERVFIVGHLRGTSRPKVFPITGQSKKTIKVIFRPKHKIDNEYEMGRRVYSKDGLSPTKSSRSDYAIISKKGNLKNKKHASTLTGGGHSGGNHSDMDLLKQGKNIRRLTPTECERLQGFPDGWTEGISNSQRYKCLGNAVTVNVIKTIFKKWKIVHKTK